ncbi:alpha/beta hydrolase fold domain-containing protein [Streptomyces sp. NPDC002143]
MTVDILGYGTTPPPRDRVAVTDTERGRQMISPSPQLHPSLAGRLYDRSTSHGGETAGTWWPGLFDPVGPPESWALHVADGLVPTPEGRIRIRFYRRQTTASRRPCLVWMHGGGFSSGDLDMPEAHEVARGIAGRTDTLVVSVDYRLCTGGTHFPAPHDDVIAVLRWVREHADGLGVDPVRIAVGGASAGGNLAAGAALRLTEEGRPPWKVLLAYPVLHPLLVAPSAAAREALAALPAGLRRSPDNMVGMAERYLGASVDTAIPWAFPALAEDLSDFPPTCVETNEFDDLRPSGENFADLLRRVGVPVLSAVAPGVLHGHLNVVGLDVAHESLDRFAAFLRHRGE